MKNLFMESLRAEMIERAEKGITDYTLYCKQGRNNTFVFDSIIRDEFNEVNLDQETADHEGFKKNGFVCLTTFDEDELFEIRGDEEEAYCLRDEVLEELFKKLPEVIPFEDKTDLGKIFDKYDRDEKLTREENIILRAVQEASAHTDVINITQSMEWNIERVAQEKDEAFEEKDIKYGISLARCITVLQTAQLYMLPQEDFLVDEKFEHCVKELEQMYGYIEDMDKDAGRNANIAKTYIQHAIKWLSVKH